MSQSRSIPSSSRRRSCPLRRPGDARCAGPVAVRVTDAYGQHVWGCPVHAAQALALVDRSRVTRYRRHSALTDTTARLRGRG